LFHVKREVEVMPLFEVAVVLMPTKKGVEDGTEQEALLTPPTAVIANDLQGAALAAGRTVTLPAGVDMNRVQVIVRPFK
jgi:hypothetical protein